jgi:hypothetical protein
MAYIQRGKNIACGRVVVTTTGTAVQVSTANTPCFGIEITAESDNTGLIVVGCVSVVAAIATRKGIPMGASDVYTTYDVDNLNKIYLDSTVNGDGVTYAYYY